MVGLSVLLEAQKRKTPQVINKTTMIILNNNNNNKPSPPCPSVFQPPSTFLDQCFLCGKRLLPGKDIYMYKGDRAFCSVDCRCKQIFMDEELEATSPTSTASSSSHQRKAARNRPRAIA